MDTRQEQLYELANRIDPERLWQRPALEHRDWPQEKQDQLHAGVSLRRYAEMLQPNRWLVIPPNGSVRFSAPTLEKTVDMVTGRKGEPHHPTTLPFAAFDEFGKGADDRVQDAMRRTPSVPLGWMIITEGDKACVVAPPDKCGGLEVSKYDKPLANRLLYELAIILTGQSTEVERLRVEQAAAVMPLIGPLLDAWEGTDVDARLVKEEAPDLLKALNAIRRAMEGN